MDTQTAAEKREEVRESFSTATEEELATPPGIEKFFEDYGKAARAQDAEQLRSLYRFDLMFESAVQQDLVPTEIRRKKPAVVKVMRQTLGTQFADPVQGISWHKIEIRRVRMIRDQNEAVVFARHWDESDTPWRTCWWLVEDRDHWYAYDLEVLDVAMRYSTMLGVGFIAGKKGGAATRLLPRFLEICELAGAGNTDEELLAELEGMESADFPPALEALRLNMVAAFYLDAGRPSDCLKASQAALSLQPATPMALLNLGDAYVALDQPKKALEEAEKYAGLLGKDADYCSLVGDAHRGLGQTEDAIRSYELGLADDPLSGVSVLGLLRTLPVADAKMVQKHYEALRGVDEWFVGFCELLLEEEDTKTLAALIEMHKKVMPDDPNLAEYEEALGERP